MAQNISLKNKKAYFQYEISDKVQAGIQLTGTEIKSIRQGKVSFVDSYCQYFADELWVKGIHIAEYTFGSYNNHEPKRDRKLLLNRKELDKLRGKVKEKGFSIIPLRLFINENGIAKLEIALARGKKQFDKREDLKRKDVSKKLDQIRKG